MGNQITATQHVLSLADCGEITDYTALEAKVAKYRCVVKDLKATAATPSDKKQPTTRGPIEVDPLDAIRNIMAAGDTSRQGEVSMSVGEPIGEPSYEYESGDESRSRRPSFSCGDEHYKIADAADTLLVCPNCDFYSYGNGTQFCLQCDEESDSGSTVSEDWCPPDESLIKLQTTINELSRDIQALNLDEMIDRLGDLEEVKELLTALKD